MEGDRRVVMPGRLYLLLALDRLQKWAGLIPGRVARFTEIGNARS